MFSHPNRPHGARSRPVEGPNSVWRSENSHDIRDSECERLVELHEVEAGIESSVSSDNGFDPDSDSRFSMLIQRLKEFERLLDASAAEETVHQWLKERHNWFILDADVADVRSKVQFGRYVSDFVLTDSAGACKVVEIERPSAQIFCKDGCFTNHFYRACQQVQDWLHEIAMYPDYYQRNIGSEAVLAPKGVVIIGRAEQINTHVKRSRWQAKRREQLEILTYDDLLQRTYSLLRALWQACGP